MMRPVLLKCPMAKSHSVFVCQSCGYSQSQWAGKCPNCDTWGSLVETIPEGGSTGSSSRKVSASAAVILADLPSTGFTRKQTGISELDRVLGGGFVQGHVVLLAGEPGIGKSTLLLQTAENSGDTLYVAGEESPVQIKLRSERLGLSGKNIEILDETDVDAVLATLREKSADGKLPQLVVVDSIQTMQTSDLMGIPGSVGQVRECAHRLTKFAKSHKMPLVLVGQITKGGSVAGPATLAHMVDTVCWFEGEPERDLRILRTIKNRFGATDEIGVFRMQEKGLMGVDDIEALFIDIQQSASGSVITSILEGSRPLLVEVQSLVVPTKMPIPRRVTSGVDIKRVDVILAVLTKHARLPLYDNDVFVNAVGGIAIKEPGADLAIALSLASSVLGKALPPKTAVIGEVGLLGEIRPVLREKERVKQAKRQGFKTVITHETSNSLQKLVTSLFK